MAFLLWLQETGIARYVQESEWGYPLVLSSHALGMAMLAGVVMMICLRVLGFGRGMPLHYLRNLVGIAWVGLAFNLVSGLMLFAADAVTHFGNIAFRIKIILLLVGGTLVWLLARRIFATDTLDDAQLVAPSTRAIAGLTLLVWTGVIVAGRLIAYAT